MTAEEVMSTGMVNRVVPRDELDAETRALAEQIAKMPPFALRQAKRAVNQTLDVQGFYAAIQSVFDIHQTGHGNALSCQAGGPCAVNLDEMKPTSSSNQVKLSSPPSFASVRVRSADTTLARLTVGEAWHRARARNPRCPRPSR
jgi:hypothetical protein